MVIYFNVLAGFIGLVTTQFQDFPIISPFIAPLLILFIEQFH